MDDLSWILADGESLEDALEEFTAEAKSPELLRRKHDLLKAMAKEGEVEDDS